MGYIAGIRLGDIITRINNVYTEGLTLLEAQLLIQRSGKNLQIFVKGYVTSIFNKLSLALA